MFRFGARPQNCAAMTTYRHFADASALINASVLSVFDFLDDQSNLSMHMSKPSPMMLGTTMRIYMDELQTRTVGSKFGFTGRILGIPLAVDEVVVGREPPSRKIWETLGQPRLWVIGRYKMGFELTPEPSGTRVWVYIDYDRPPAGLPRLLGRLFGRMYARWCTRQMVVDAQRHFADAGTAPRSLPV